VANKVVENTPIITNTAMTFFIRSSLKIMM
jgi:hypothetical protein